MALFKRKAKQQEAPAPAAEPKSFVIIKMRRSAIT